MNAYRVTCMAQNGNRVNRSTLTVVAATADAAAGAVLDTFDALGVAVAVTGVEALAAGELF